MFNIFSYGMKYENLFFMIMLCLYKQGKKMLQKCYMETVVVALKSSWGTIPLTFYLSVLTRKPNAVKSFHLLMAPGKLPVSLPNAKLFGIAKLENAF